MKDRTPALRSCFICNGTGLICIDCGEAVNVCECGDDSNGSTDCENCEGTGIAPADRDREEPTMPSDTPDRVTELMKWWEQHGEGIGSALADGEALSLPDTTNLLALAKLGAAAIRRCEAEDELHAAHRRNSSCDEVRRLDDNRRTTRENYQSALKELAP